MSFQVRLGTRDDAAEVLAVYAPYVTDTVISFEEVPPSVVAMRDRIAACLDGGRPWLIAEEEGRVVGYAYAGAHRSRDAYRFNAESSVYVRTDRQRRGIGRGLYERLLAVLEAQGFVRALAGITLPNPGSVGIHESFGFTPVGVYQGVGFKHGRWHDVGWWERALNGRSDAPVLRSLSELAERGELSF